ncbi:hypothetical protein NMD99_06615 [Wolbachia endosymbiont of Listronotus oregonensis]|uniref:hypothetical protein n=1 Tax=unclassified Wolbachia TaxID=2640676 RepID=UPI00209D4AB8|nr:MULTISPECIES: hypothetical protein [Rickettsiales]MBV2146553.1 hypothetical protein [Wolbachia endosymbiont of Pissodes strobi]WMT84276.1 hypothetical protein NMD99_06615 [Wolbachia endosymbiont of Listronotus oregonensis]
MYLGTQEGNSLNLNLTHDHNVARINDAIGFLPKAWHAAKKYSVNNTLPIAVVNTWLQFSLAYITAMVITLNDLSFIATFNPTLMPTYFLVSVIFGVVLLTSLALRYIYKQEIKDEKSKDGDSPIDIKIRGGKSDEINEIAQNALTIEIVPDLVDKKQGFSIILPISEKQGEILENKRQENRNKVILLTVPYVLSGLIVAGALIQNKFSFANVHGWEEWGFIAFVSAVFIVGICIALSKLKSNEVNNACNIVKKFDNVDILLPWRKGSVVSVMENKFKSEEENDPISRLGRLVNRHLTDFIDKICCLFKNDLLKPANINIKETLGSIGKDLKALLDKLEKDIKKNVDEVKTTASKEITDCLKNISKSVDVLCKEVSGDVKGKLSEVDVEKVMSLVNNLSNLAETLEDRISRLKPGARMGLSGATFADERLPNAPNNPNPQQNGQGSSSQSNTDRSANKDMQTSTNESADQEIQTQLLEEHNRPSEPDNEDNTDQLVDEEKKLQEKMAVLEKQDRVRQLKKDLFEREKTDEWKEKINGKPSDFLYYLLESIKLEEKDNKEEKVEATLRDFDNKIIIHWKDGSQTTCHIKKQGDLPSTKVDFVNQNIQAAWEMARGKSL